jgi:hypothetical protein
MRWTTRIAKASAFAVAVMAIGQAAAEDCPDSRTGLTGYVVERGSGSRTEVFHDGHIVRTVVRYNGNQVLETTQFEGLFDLDRIDRGRRTTFKPASELAKLFPMKADQKAVVDFDVTNAGASAKRTVRLHVMGTDELYIGSCKYKVLKIERSQSQEGRQAVFAEIDYYSPELKLIIAKEFKERSGQASINKFDKIYPGPANK